MADRSATDAEPDDDAGPPGRASSPIVASIRDVNSDHRLIRGIKFLRSRLPGDPEYGDPLSVTGEEQTQIVGRQIASLSQDRPGALGELGLAGVQVWQALSESRGRGHGSERMTIVFTDLVDFSSWALDAGDEAALKLLRDVDRALEPTIRDAGGRIVKRLGDGLMAVFDDPQAALDALLEGRERLDGLVCDGYDVRMRAGIHVGSPRRLGGDLFGVDVTIAARLVEQAGADEVLVSDRALALIDTGDLQVKRKRRFKVKGVPDGLTAHAVSRKRR